MKKIITILSLVSVLGFASAAQADLKIGTVDMNKIFKSYWKTQKAETAINQAKDVAKKELDSKAADYKENLVAAQKLQADLQKPELSKNKKTEEAKELQSKALDLRKQEVALNEFQHQRETDLQKKAVDMRNSIVQEIKVLVDAKAKSAGYDLIFDTSGSSLNGVPVVSYANPAYDFSDAIIAELNKDKPASADTGSKSKKD